MNRQVIEETMNEIDKKFTSIIEEINQKTEATEVLRKEIVDLRNEAFYLKGRYDTFSELLAVLNEEAVATVTE